MNESEEKYIDLLLNKCICPKSKSLFISYDKCNVDFIEKLIKKAREYGFVDILIEEKDIMLEHKLLKDLSVEEIKSHPYFYNENWNDAIRKKCAFLLVSTTFPNYFDDIEYKKIIAVNQVKTITHRKRVS